VRDTDAKTEENINP